MICKCFTPVETFLSHMDASSTHFTLSRVNFNLFAFTCIFALTLYAITLSLKKVILVYEITYFSLPMRTHSNMWCVDLESTTCIIVFHWFLFDIFEPDCEALLSNQLLSCWVLSGEQGLLCSLCSANTVIEWSSV